MTTDNPYPRGHLLGLGKVWQEGFDAHRPTLTPAENMVMTVAKAQVRDGRPVGANTTGFLLAIIDRLTQEDTDD